MDILKGGKGLHMGDKVTKGGDGVLLKTNLEEPLTNKNCVKRGKKATWSLICSKIWQICTICEEYEK